MDKAHKSLHVPVAGHYVGTRVDYRLWSRCTTGLYEVHTGVLYYWYVIMLLCVVLVQENAEFGVREMLLDIASKTKVLRASACTAAICKGINSFTTKGIHWLKHFTR